MLLLENSEQDVPGLNGRLQRPVQVERADGLDAVGARVASDPTRLLEREQNAGNRGRTEHQDTIDGRVVLQRCCDGRCRAGDIRQGDGQHRVHCRRVANAPVGSQTSAQALAALRQRRVPCVGRRMGQPRRASDVRGGQPSSWLTQRALVTPAMPSCFPAACPAMGSFDPNWARVQDPMGGRPSALIMTYKHEQAEAFGVVASRIDADRRDPVGLHDLVDGGAQDLRARVR